VGTGCVCQEAVRIGISSWQWGQTECVWTNVIPSARRHGNYRCHAAVLPVGYSYDKNCVIMVWGSAGKPSGNEKLFNCCCSLLINCKMRLHTVHTPWSRVLDKLTGSQLVKKFPIFYGTWRFITVQHFIFQLTHTTLKNVELLKHFKIRKLLQHVSVYKETIIREPQ